MRNTIRETDNLRNQLFSNSVRVVDQTTLRNVDIANGIRCMTDEDRFAAVDPMVLFVHRMQTGR